MVRQGVVSWPALALAGLLAHGQQPEPIRVHVLDKSGEPIAGAAVTTFDDSRAARALTGADGWCSLAIDAASGPAFRARIEADGYFHQDTLQSRVTEISVRLFRATSMSGCVLGADTREPLAGATLEFLHPTCRHCAPEVVACDAQGRFTLPSVPLDAQATFAARAEGYARQGFVLGVTTAPFAHEFELARGFEVRGAVLDAATGKPLANARVATRAKVEDETHSDAAGRFALRVLPNPATGRVDLEVEAEGYCKLRFLQRARDQGAAGELELPLYRPAFIAGVVVDARGNPAARAEVAVRESNDWLEKRRATLGETGDDERIPLDQLPDGWFVASGHPNHKVVADEQGRFRTQGVVPWSPRVLLEVEHASIPRFHLDAGPLAGPGSTLELRIAPPPPVAGGRVAGKLRVNGEIVLGGIEWRGASRSGTAWLDPQGNYSATGVEPGRVVLQPVKLQTRSIVFGDVLLAPAAEVAVELERETRHDFELDCELARIAGRVVTASGAPCAGVGVAATQSARGSKGSALTAADGSFALSFPKSDQLSRVVALHGPAFYERLDVAAGDEHVDFVVADLGRAFVRFVDRRTRAALVPSSIAWRRKGARSFERRDLVLEPLSEDGRWYPFQIPLGEHEFLPWTMQPGYAPGTVTPFVLGAGDEPPRLVFELELGLGLDLELAPGSARPGEEAADRVWLLEALPELFGDAQPPWTKDNVAVPTYADRTRRLGFDARGRARIAGLRPGPHRFVSYSAEVRVEPAQIDVVEGSPPVVVRWSRVR